MQTFDFSTMSDQAIREALQAIRCGLTVQEARQLHAMLQRAPTVAELVLFGIEGSEHCSYKSSRTYLKQFPTEGPDVIIGAKEDAGIIRVARDMQGKGYAIVLSHESHNHPSQVVPYEGAATGIGGNVRDVCCMGANVVALADDLRFGELSNPHNVWLLHEVVAGIAGYGNPIGVPNIAGGVQFHEGYEGNCLVTVVTLGTVAEDAIIHSYAPKNASGYDLILVGKATDTSGFGGASFASFQLEQQRRQADKGAVQEPNAFLGRHLIKSSAALFQILKERGETGNVAFKDLGAGGIACASVELAESGGYGAHVAIDAVHVADAAIPPHVILCAETQERYMWVSPPRLTGLILSHYNHSWALPEVSAGAEARVIGSIVDNGRYVVTSSGQTIVDAPAAAVCHGFAYHRPVGDPPALQEEPVLSTKADIARLLPAILADPNVADKSCIYNRYDKQVQGWTQIEAGRADSGVIRPFDDPSFPAEIRDTGISLTTDQNPRWNSIDAYQGALNAVVESYCNTRATGCIPIALSDCLCYGNPEKPEQMRQFAEGCRGIADACRALDIPVIAGNVSLYNESEHGSIPPSPMVAMLGKINDSRLALQSAFQQPGSAILMLGERFDACGGSIYYRLHGKLGNQLPRPDLPTVKRMGSLMETWTAHRLIRSCHDISEGGVAAALSEMAIMAGIGCRCTFPTTLPIERMLFSESCGFCLEVDMDHVPAMLEDARKAGLYCTHIGQTQGKVVALQHTEWPLAELEHIWRDGLRKHIG